MKKASHRHPTQRLFERDYLPRAERRRKTLRDVPVDDYGSRRCGDALEMLALRSRRINFVSPHVPRDIPQKISFISSQSVAFHREPAFSKSPEMLKFQGKPVNKRTSGIDRKSPKMELIVGVEPTTSALRMLCSAIKLYQRTLLCRCICVPRSVIVAERVLFFNAFGG